MRPVLTPTEVLNVSVVPTRGAGSEAKGVVRGLGLSSSS